MKEKLNAYFEKEYQAVLKYLQNPPALCDTPREKERMVWNAVNRCLGAAKIAQDFGLPYEDTQMYDDYLAKFRKLVLDI